MVILESSIVYLSASSQGKYLVTGLDDKRDEIFRAHIGLGTGHILSVTMESTVVHKYVVA